MSTTLADKTLHSDLSADAAGILFFNCLLPHLADLYGK